MSRKIVFSLIGVGIALGVGFALAARMMSGNGSIIPRDVVAGGGGRSTAAGGQYVLNATIGQPATAIMTAGNGTRLVGGFQTMTPRPSTGARRWTLY